MKSEEVKLASYFDTEIAATVHMTMTALTVTVQKTVKTAMNIKATIPGAKGLIPSD